MLDYELCKKLKDCGFPQDHVVLMKSCPHYAVSNKKYPKGDYTRSCGCFLVRPTLSELIEACPKNYKKEDYFDGDFTLKWWGDDMGWHVGYEQSDGWYEGAEGEGKTPEEAVADLFIKIHANS